MNVVVEGEATTAPEPDHGLTADQRRELEAKQRGIDARAAAQGRRKPQRIGDEIGAPARQEPQAEQRPTLRVVAPPPADPLSNEEHEHTKALMGRLGIDTSRTRTAATALPPDESDEALHDPYATLVRPGEYLVGFVRCEKFTVWAKPRWAIMMKIAEEGPHLGKLVFFFMTAMESGKRRAPRTALFNTYVIATGRKPPKNLAQVNPEKFLADCRFTAKVITSTKDSNGTVLPEAVWYSKIKSLVKRVDGTPPVLRDAR